MALPSEHRLTGAATANAADERGSPTSSAPPVFASFLHEMDENLHRAESTALERDIQISR
jgi:hypothetical protein